MADAIKCPVCGENNPKEFEFCQYCQSRLQPLTGNLRGENTPITPGQSPTKKSTADLEPILPQWLRDARSSARDAEAGDFPQTVQPPKTPASSPSASQDLLAGLRSQNDDEDEETPDWLANITGGAPSSKKQKAEEPADVRWVELGGTKNDAAPAPDMPDWMRALTPSASQSSSPPSGLTDWMREASGESQPQPAADSQDWLRQMSTDNNGTLFDDSEDTLTPPASSDAPDWLRSLDAADANTQSSAASSPAQAPDWLNTLGAQKTPTPAVSSAPDWLNQASQNTSPAQTSDTPDWLRSLDAAGTSKNNDAFFGGATPAAAADTPDWLSSLGAQTSPASDTPDWLQSLDSTNAGAKNDNLGNATPAAADTLDWLSSLGAANNTPAPTLPSDDTPDWLKGLNGETSSAPTAAPASLPDEDWLKGNQSGGNQPAQSDQLSEIEMPAWLSDSSTPAKPPTEPKKEEAALGDVPSWLKAAAPQSTIFDDLSTTQPAATTEADSEPDWLNTFKSLDPAPPAPLEPPPAFAPNAADGNAEALFTDMPDWLNSVETPAPTPSSAEIPAEASIEASQLPSWVQAMRPVDTGVTQISASSGDQTLEARGALAGLQGVLPAAPGYAPTSKPKAYSLKLQATDEQLSQAALLEQILAAETSPVPIASFATLRASRGLRWALTLVFFSTLFAVLFLRTQIFSLPVGVPLEISGAEQVVQNLQNNAPVLVAFDYEPARVGEMEVAAAPLFDQLVLLRNPRLTFISTNENSAILSERFMLSGPMAEHYKNGLQYLNLGYLPGGQMGIRAFAQNPRATTPFDISFAPAWDTAQLQGVNSFADFAAFIIITDSADSARAWIEQTTSVRGSIPVVVIASAQAAPMIQPYYASGQITGLVSGLYGGAIFSESTARPVTPRLYWDAYSIGMLIAAVLIVAGGLWNLFLGSRDRAAAREAK